MKKRGQFYLVATIVIVALFLSYIALMNYSIKIENMEIYKFVEELDTEGEKVLDYEEATGANVFDDFAKDYTYYVGDNRDIYFIVGTSGSLDAFNYDDENKIPLDVNINDDEATVEIEDNSYTFGLRPGKNFYFIMAEKYKNQEYFIANTE